MHKNLAVTGGQSPGRWQPANAMLSVCIPLAFGKEKCGGVCPGDPLADHPWPLGLLQGRAVLWRAGAAPWLGLRLCRVCWTWLLAWRWCHPRATAGWDGAGGSCPHGGCGVDGPAAAASSGL